jgi:hypothetical protein
MDFTAPSPPPEKPSRVRRQRRQHRVSTHFRPRTPEGSSLVSIKPDLKGRFHLDSPLPKTGSPFPTRPSNLNLLSAAVNVSQFLPRRVRSALILRLRCGPVSQKFTRPQVSASTSANPNSKGRKKPEVHDYARGWTSSRRTSTIPSPSPSTTWCCCPNFPTAAWSTPARPS